MTALSEGELATLRSLAHTFVPAAEAARVASIAADALVRAVDPSQLLQLRLVLRLLEQPVANLATGGGFTAFRDGDLIVAKITPCMENGKAAICTGLVNGHGFGSTEFHVLRPTGAAQATYAFHFIRQESFRRAAADHMTGSVGQKRVPATYLANVQIPLPPLSEQKRIVAKGFPPRKCFANFVSFGFATTRRR